MGIAQEKGKISPRVIIPVDGRGKEMGVTGRVYGASQRPGMLAEP